MPQEPNFASAPISSLFALLSFWDMIYNDEYNLGSSCLNSLNNFGLVSSQKLQNLTQNMISRISGTLMCKSG